MSKLKKLVPSAHSLVVFEAAARNLSFKLAADELNVTQPSVSQAMRSLEGQCQVRLFVRENRGVRLTEAGRILFEGVRAGFLRIEESLEAIAKQSDHYLTLAVSTAFAVYWLMPQLAEFQRAHPNIKLKVLTTDRDIEPDSNIDMTIWLRARDWSHANSWRLCDEVVFPVCTNGYLAESPPLEVLPDLAYHKLLHYSELYRERLGWKDWLALSGMEAGDLSPDVVFNDNQLVLQAALAGQGVALGWSFTSQQLLRTGMLIRPLKDEVRTGNSFHLVTSRFSDEDKTAKFRNWLLSKTSQLR